MTFDELMKCEQDTPVIMRDGKVGLLIRWMPRTQEVGIQVPGEEDIRWRSPDKIFQLRRSNIVGSGLIEMP